MHCTAPIRVIAACIVGFIAAIALVAPALADKPSSDQIDDTFPEEACGLPLTTHVAGSVQSSSGKVQIHLTVTWSNATGDAIVIQIRNMIKELDPSTMAMAPGRSPSPMSDSETRSASGTRPCFSKLVARVSGHDLPRRPDYRRRRRLPRQRDPHDQRQPRTEDETLLCQVVMQELG